MSQVPSHYAHFLVRRVVDGHPGWLAPYELSDGDDTTGAGLAIPMNSRGEPFAEYWLDVRLTDESRSEVLYYLLKPSNGQYVLETPAAELPFVEHRVNGQDRALPYVGELYHPDFAHELVEIVPVQDKVYELMFGASGVTLIGCDPFEHYQRRDGSRLG